MNTKLTLKLDDKVIKSAKDYARRQHKSLSSLVENYFRMIAGNSATNEKITPLVRELSGVIRMPKDAKPREEYTEYLEEKYK